MAKYIRTKDGLYEVVVENDEIEVCQVKGHGSIDYKDIVKQSDNIEELFDEFVRICERFDIREVLDKNEKQVLLKKGLKTNAITCFYGAIWTDKGLIYVAKMNEEGGWKLLWRD